MICVLVTIVTTHTPDMMVPTLCLFKKLTLNLLHQNVMPKDPNIHICPKSVVRGGRLLPEAQWRQLIKCLYVQHMLKLVLITSMFADYITLLLYCLSYIVSALGC